MKGLTGIANLGNTCFLNSCLQILNHTYELHEYVDSEKSQMLLEMRIKQQNVDAILFFEWNSLRQTMASGNGNGIISPNRFVQCVQYVAEIKKRELFTGWMQNDLCEFLLFMVECMHNSMARTAKMKITGNAKNETDEIAVECYNLLDRIYSKEYSEIMEMFYGTYVTKISSVGKKERLSLTAEHFFVVDLQVCPTIYAGFDLFTKPELMEGDNTWFNESTGEKQPIIKECVFFTLPTILVICLKRFSPDGTKKLQNLVDFPLFNLDVSKYVKGYYANQYVYDLYGVANHMGSVQGGHYTAYIKHKEGQWFHCNDTEMTPIDESKIVSPYAYCLFYRKK